jgi:hypothetical protein
LDVDQLSDNQTKAHDHDDAEPTDAPSH